jgi:hypothetical protein
LRRDSITTRITSRFEATVARPHRVVQLSVPSAAPVKATKATKAPAG